MFVNIKQVGRIIIIDPKYGVLLTYFFKDRFSQWSFLNSSRVISPGFVKAWTPMKTAYNRSITKNNLKSFIFFEFTDQNCFKKLSFTMAWSWVNTSDRFELNTKWMYESGLYSQEKRILKKSESFWEFF